MRNKSQIIKDRHKRFPQWRKIKRETLEQTDIADLPYRAIIGDYWMLLDKCKREIITEHKYVFYQHYRQKPRKGECIHHIDGNKLNNNIKNLRLMKSNSHSKLHSKVRMQVMELRKRRLRK